ncbi:hypothetical protein, partial [Pediococcus acidilactici]|uniref:hypothetical protein n=1 Tax=Pediococcus acidilactici TaxID=1254 RepID=UPI00300C7D9E
VDHLGGSVELAVGVLKQALIQQLYQPLEEAPLRLAIKTGRVVHPNRRVESDPQKVRIIPLVVTWLMLNRLCLLNELNDYRPDESKLPLEGKGELAIILAGFMVAGEVQKFLG